MTEIALWRVYISGRRGFEKELGLVIAPANTLNWAKLYGGVLAQNIVKRGPVDELLIAAQDVEPLRRDYQSEFF